MKLCGRNGKSERTLVSLVKSGNVASACRLLQQEICPLEERDIDGCHGGATALFWASAYGFNIVVDLLLWRGARVNTTSSETGASPLHAAIDNSHNLIARSLVKNGADVNQPTDAGETPLHTAVRRNNVEVVCLLLVSEADVSLLNDAGKSASHEAAALGYHHIVQIIKEYTRPVPRCQKRGKRSFSQPPLGASQQQNVEDSCKEFKNSSSGQEPMEIKDHNLMKYVHRVSPGSRKIVRRKSEPSENVDTSLVPVYTCNWII